MATAVPQQSQADAKPWQFKKGQSGNPAGRKRVTPEERQAKLLSRDAAQKAVEALMGDALKVIKRGLRDPDVAVSGKFAFDVLDRSLGKAAQRVIADINTVEHVTTVSPELLRLAAMRLLAANAPDATDATETQHAGD